MSGSIIEISLACREADKILEQHRTPMKNWMEQVLAVIVRKMNTQHHLPKRLRRKMGRVRFVSALDRARSTAAPSDADACG